MSKSGTTDAAPRPDLLSEPHPDWMVPLDVAILELLADVEIPVLPGTLAYNLRRSRPDVVARCHMLAEFDLVATGSRSKNAFYVTDEGRALLAGEADPFTLEYDARR